MSETKEKRTSVKFGFLSVYAAAETAVRHKTGYEEDAMSKENKTVKNGLLSLQD